MSAQEAGAFAQDGADHRSVAQLFDPLDEKIAAEVVALGTRRTNGNAVHGALPGPELVDRFRGTAIPETGWDLRRYIELLGRDIVPNSVVTSSPRCLAHMTPPIPAAMAPLASLVVSLNQNLVRTDASTTLTLCERQALGMLHRMVFQRSARFYERHTQDPAAPWAPSSPAGHWPTSRRSGARVMPLSRRAVFGVSDSRRRLRAPATAAPPSSARSRCTTPSPRPRT